MIKMHASPVQRRRLAIERFLGDLLITRPPPRPDPGTTPASPEAARGGGLVKGVAVAPPPPMPEACGWLRPCHPPPTHMKLILYCYLSL